MIVTKPNVEWGFQCTYDTEYEIGESLTVDAAAISQGFSQTNAQFAFSFDFYTDGTFADIQDTATYLVGQRLNFGGIYPYFHTLSVTGFKIHKFDTLAYSSRSLKFYSSIDEWWSTTLKLDLCCIYMRSDQRWSHIYHIWHE